MAKQLCSLPFTLFSLTLSLGLALSYGLPTQAQPKPASQSQDLPGRAIAKVTFDPPGDARPDDTAGGASRGDGCAQQAIAFGECIIPLMPGNKDGLTLSERPTFFVYVPETSAKEIFFSLMDGNSRHLYQAKISIAGKSGIVSFTLPKDAPALEVGKTYLWAFIVVGEQGLRPDSPGVEGIIERIQPNSALSSQLQKGSPLDRAALYGQNGIWYDTLATLAEARRSQPSDATLTATWEDLLKSVGLDAIATKPLLN